MINSIFETVFSLFYQVSRFFVGLISLPLYHLLYEVIPDLNDYLSDFYEFVNTYILRTLGFARAAFCNVTCVPIGLFNIVVSLFFVFIVIGLAAQPMLFILNAFNNIKKGLLK